MLLGQNKQEKADSLSANEERWIISLITLGQYEEAYLLLKRVEKKSATTAFNLALCYLYAGEYSTALKELDEADLLFPPTSFISFSSDPVAHQLNCKQSDSAVYKNPWSEWYVQQFPLQAKESLMRIKIDCYRHLGIWSKVLQEGAPLEKYYNVKEALLLARKATGV